MKKVTFNVRPTLGQFTAAIFGPVPTESPAMGVDWLSKRITLHSCPCVYVWVFRKHHVFSPTNLQHATSWPNNSRWPKLAVSPKKFVVYFLFILRQLFFSLFLFSILFFFCKSENFISAWDFLTKKNQKYFQTLIYIAPPTGADVAAAVHCLLSAQLAMDTRL